MPSAILGHSRYSRVYRVSYNGSEFARKRYHNLYAPSASTVFRAEANAYLLLYKHTAANAALERIPCLYKLSRTQGVLDLELVRGPTLRSSLPDLSSGQFARFKQEILGTVHALHLVGICHGDISLDNIHVLPTRLLDLSHARLRTKTASLQAWNKLVKDDLRDVECTFQLAIAMKNSLAAIAIMETNTVCSDIGHQQGLADIINKSYHSEDLLQVTLKMKNPIPSLALAITRQFHRRGDYGITLAMFASYTPPSPESGGAHVPALDSEVRSPVRLRGEIARSQAMHNPVLGCDVYQQAIQFSIEMLGLYDEDTTRLRFSHIKCQEELAYLPQALELLNSFLSDLEQTSSLLCNDRLITELSGHRDKLHQRLVETRWICPPN